MVCGGAAALSSEVLSADSKALEDALTTRQTGLKFGHCLSQLADCGIQESLEDVRRHGLLGSDGQVNRSDFFVIEEILFHDSSRTCLRCRLKEVICTIFDLFLLKRTHTRDPLRHTIEIKIEDKMRDFLGKVLPKGVEESIIMIHNQAESFR